MKINEWISLDLMFVYRNDIQMSNYFVTKAGVIYREFDNCKGVYVPCGAMDEVKYNEKKDNA